MQDMERIGRVDSFEQFGFKGEIHNDDDQFIGKYQVIGFNKVWAKIESEEFRLSKMDLIEVTENRNLHLVPIWN